MKLFRWLIVVGVVVFLVGCGGGSDGETAETTKESPKPERKLKEFPMTLDGLASPENAGLMTAIEKGYFADLGLTVHAMSPSPPSRPVKYVIERVVDIAVSHQPQVVMAQAKGRPIVALGSLLSQPTVSMIWLKKSKIEDIADLRGKTVAIPGVPYQEGLLKAALARGGLTLADVEVKEVDYKLIPALVSGRADAIFGGSWNVEGVELESRGLDPIITRAAALGIPRYDELVVIARRNLVAEDPEFYRRFMAVVKRGTAAALKDPAAATEAILTQRDGEGYPVNRRATEVGLEATLPLLSRTGRIDPKQEARLVDWMQAQGLVQRKPGG